MRRPPTPEVEPERLAALASYQVLDSPEEPAFDSIARLTAQLCAVPMATLTFVSTGRAWFKSNFGFPLVELPRNASFCAYAILSDAVLVVPDASKDERFAEAPVVEGPPGVRFYAGAPLITDDGYRLGALAALDVVPRELSPDALRGLEELAAMVVNLLELRRAKLRYPANHSEFMRVLEHMPVPFTVTRNHAITYANRAYLQLSGCDDPRELLGRPPPILGAWDEPAPIPRDVELMRCNGRVVLVELTTTELPDTDAMVHVARDVTEDRARERRELVAPRADPLTGLTNRRGLEEVLTRELARARRHREPVSFVIFDIDQLERVKATLGHTASDTVLQRIASLLISEVRESDLAAHWGGEELVAVLPHTGLSGARAFAERMRTTVEGLEFAPEVGRITISAGISQWDSGESSSLTFARADEALRRAKAAGRNCAREALTT